MSGRAMPKVFAIGLPHSGGDVLAALFQNNGYNWVHHHRGKLAQSIAYARANGSAPLIEWPKAVGFSELYGPNKTYLPAFNLQDHLDYLLSEFSDAYFIQTRRDPADWIAARFWADDGIHRQTAAWYAQMQEPALPAHWMEEDAQHTQHCARLFAGNPRFLNINLSTEPIETLQKHLTSDFKLYNTVDLPDLSVSADDIEAVLTHIDTIKPIADQPPCDMSFVRHVSDFAREKTGRSGKPKVLSGKAVTWGEDGHVTDRHGKDVAMARNGDIFTMSPESTQFERAQSALNELIEHGAKAPLHIDMMDARRYGTPDERNPPRHTIAYNRHEGAENVTLWPLGGYHTLAPTGQVGGYPKDDIPFEDKEDTCVWLGSLSGRMVGALTPKGREQRGVYGIRDRAETLSDDSPEWDDLIADLMGVPRYNVVQTYRHHPDFKVGLVLRSRTAKLANTPAFKGLHEPARPQAWFHKFRYILSLSGNDTGSNFLPAAASNALILKEEDGWELFYTGAFKPWVHYIPLVEGALDVEEKLRWARANPTACKDISTAATILFDKFANPNNRAAYLREIASHLNAKT